MARHAEASRRLTPHHRIHSIAMQLEVKELMGMWASITAVAAKVERAVAENLATPCIRNSRSLLVEAVTHAYAGEKDDARRLEEEGLELAFGGSASASSGRACGSPCSGASWMSSSG